MFAHYVPRRGISDGVIYFVDLMESINFTLILVSAVIVHIIVWHEQDDHIISDGVLTTYYILTGLFAIIILLHVAIKYKCYAKYANIIDAKSDQLTQEVEEDEAPLMTKENDDFVIDLVQSNQPIDITNYTPKLFYPGLD